MSEPENDFNKDTFITNFQYQMDRGDPIGWILFHKLGLSTAIIVLLVLAFGVLEGLVWPWLGGYKPLIADYIWYAVLVPVIWVYYANSRVRISRLFEALCFDDIFVSRDTDDFEEMLRHIKLNYGFRRWMVVALILSILIVFVIRIVHWRNYPPPSISFPPAMLSSLVLMFIYGYVGSLTVIRELNTIFWLRLLFKQNKIQVQPLHPDGAGGLAFIGVYYLRLTFFIVVIALWISLWDFIIPLFEGQAFRYSWGLAVGWILYLAITPVSFFLPLWATHRSMKSQKKVTLQQVSHRYDIEFVRVQSALVKDDVLDRNIAELNSLKDLKKHIEDTFPTWPFNSSTLRRFSLSLLSPAIAYIVPIALDFFIK